MISDGARVTLYNTIAGIGALVAMVALSSCATTHVAVSPTCVPLKTYTAAEQAAASAQIKALSASDPSFAASPIAGMIIDYKAMRDADRACLGTGPAG